MIGQTISHYQILEKLGEGGMGVVYKARQLKLDSFVALKFLPPHAVSQGTAKKRFIHEAKATSSLEHPNICAVYDIDETPDGQMFIVMPCYEGNTLAEKAESGPLDFNEALDIAVQIASGLAKAHASGITHRDIKPANIFLTDDGFAKILDFGLAKLAGQSRMTRTGTTVGTVRYMSPEQARGEETDQRSDVFSLGVVFYELLTGALPFDADHEQAVIYRIISDDPEPLSRHRDGLPTDAQRVIDKALTKNREDRYPSAGELLEDLKRLQAGVTVSRARRRLKHGRFVRPALRSALSWRRVVFAALFGVVALAAGYLMYSRLTPVAEKETVVAVFPFSVNGDEKFNYLGEGMVDLLNMCMDGAGDLTVVDSRALLNAVSGEGAEELDQRRSESVAKRLGASLFVRGNLLEAGGRFQATATLYAADGGQAATARAAVDGEAEVFDLAQGLARQFLLAITGKESDGEIGSIDTSFEALRAYLEGEKQYRHGEFEAAVASYQHAVEADSTLARAWAKLSWAAYYTPKYTDLGREATRHALELRDRLSTRDRSMLEADDAYGMSRFDEAEELLRGIIASHPTDGTAWFSLGDVLLASAALRARSFDEVIDALERAVSLGVRDEETLIDKYWASAAGGKPDRALECLERYLELHPKGDNATWFRTILAFQTGTADDREAAVERLRQIDDPPFVLLVVQNLIWFRNLSGAARAARIFTDASNPPEVRARGYIELSQIDLAHGRWRSAQRNLDAADLLDPADALEYRALFSAAPFLKTSDDELRALHEKVERWDPGESPSNVPATSQITPHEGVHRQLRLYLLGLLSVRLGDQAKSAQYADQLSALGGDTEGAAVAKHLARCVRAHMDVEAGNRERALEELERGRLRGFGWEKGGLSGFFSQMYERYTRAELLRAAGQYEEALRWYDTAGRHASFDVIYLAPSHLRRAEIYEQLGEKQQAIEHYRKFIEMWTDCDPELEPRLDDAKQALARLQSSS